MDNNINTALSSTPHKPHYIPEFYHNFYPSQEQQILNSSSAASSPMSTTLYTFNLNQSEENDNNTDVETDQNDERQQQQNDINDDDKEPMFEKPLTPSDVGKLNRLVIPKQHAEKYFPLGGGDSGGDKGLLLSFEDELGKLWRFRYSYWNSSQSYVLTKGWSRYVKEKRLDAGDVVLFERHRGDGKRLFIGSRRRRSPAQDSGGGGVAQVSSGGNNTNRVFYSVPHPYPAHHNPHYQHHHYHHQIPAVLHEPECIHAGSSPAAHNQTTTANGNNNNCNNSSKILRLFGVNLECQSADHESEPSTSDGSSLWSQGPPAPVHHSFYPDHAYHSEYHHMDYTFYRDVKPTRNRRG